LPFRQFRKKVSRQSAGRLNHLACACLVFRLTGCLAFSTNRSNP
jgi:hypothetical protein